MDESQLDHNSNGHHHNHNHHHNHHRHHGSQGSGESVQQLSLAELKKQCDTLNVMSGSGGEQSVANGGRPYLESVNSSVVALVGRPLAIQTSFCAKPRPVRVYWIHRHLALSPGLVIGPYIARDLKAVSFLSILLS